MQEYDTSYMLPVIGAVAAVVAIVPERWLKPIFIVGAVALPLLLSLWGFVYDLVTSGAGSATVALLGVTGLLFVFWSMPFLFGFAAGIIARLVFSAAKDRLSS